MTRRKGCRGDLGKPGDCETLLLNASEGDLKLDTLQGLAIFAVLRSLSKIGLRVQLNCVSAESVVARIITIYEC